MLKIYGWQDLSEVALTREQCGLIGKGYAGPAVDLDGIQLTSEQVWMADYFILHLSTISFRGPKGTKNLKITTQLYFV